MKLKCKSLIVGAALAAGAALAMPSSAAETRVIVVDYYGNCAERIDKFVDRIEQAKRPQFRAYTLSQAVDACREGRVKHANMILAELEDEWDFRAKILGKKRPE